MRYSREDACLAWLAYGALRPETIHDLLEKCGSAEAIYDQTGKKGASFLNAHHVPPASISILLNRHPQQKMHEMLVTMQKHEIGVLRINSPMYPKQLRDISQPPEILFYKGNLNCLSGKCLGVVGSRKASPQGVDATIRVCRELSETGVTIISGCAVGIDAAAHRGCLQGPSPTAAILGCGIDVDYPAENSRLKEDILRTGGLLLTECAPGVKANRYVFQMRNRIISGLSTAIILMESRIQSGSMVTVHHALDQGKEVYAYPGTSGTEWAEGAHQLLREGANYFAYAHDILDDLKWLDRAPAAAIQIQPKKELPTMTDEQRCVYNALGEGELSFDQLAAVTGLDAGALSAALTLLQIYSVVKSMPGKCYCRNESTFP